MMAFSLLVVIGIDREATGLPRQVEPSFGTTGLGKVTILFPR